MLSSQLFTRLKQEQESGGGLHHGVQTFTGIRELARRFALTFGDLIKFREGVVLIHWSVPRCLAVCYQDPSVTLSVWVVRRNGIEFVFQEFSQTPETPAPPNLPYLAILSEFSCKLLKPDKRTV